MEPKSVVVTGASTGIGEGVATVLVQRGFRVFGTVRRPADGERLQAQLGEAFLPVLMEVTDGSSVQRAAGQVRAALGNSMLAGLVNNAGISITGPLVSMPLDEFRQQLEVNLTSVLRVTQSFAGLLGTERSRAGKPGRIVNISSVGGLFAVPFLGAYAASKHGLEGMSEALRRELLVYGIDVIVVGPGSVATPIWDKAEEATAGFDDPVYGPSFHRLRTWMVAEGRKGLAPTAIGDVVLEALTARHPKVRYAPVPQKLRNWTLPRLLPKRWVDRLLAKQIGLLPSA